MRKNRLIIQNSVIGIGLFLAVFCFNALASDVSPEQTVCKFYNSLKNKDYEQAYECISKKFKDGKDKEKWVKDWKETVDFAKVEILDFSVSECKIDGDKATVHVSVDAKDMINKDGITETEIDYLVIEDSVWKIDATEVDLPDL
jgi:hypothetical protein